MTNPFDTVHPTAEYDDRCLKKREYFAAIALQGILASSDSVDMQSAAGEAVLAADCLIAALNI